MSNPNLIEKAWQELSKAVYPPSISNIQRIECRRAFYAGANALLTLLAMRTGEGTEPTPEDLKMMDHIQEEFVQYAKDLAEGRA